MLERPVQFCLEIGDSGFELRCLRFGSRRLLTLDANLGLKRQPATPVVFGACFISSGNDERLCTDLGYELPDEFCLAGS